MSSMQALSLRAPQQPRKPVTKMTRPMTIKVMAAPLTSESELSTEATCSSWRARWSTNTQIPTPRITAPIN